MKEVGLVDTSYVSIEEGVPPSYEQVPVFLIFIYLSFLFCSKVILKCFSSKNYGYLDTFFMHASHVVGKTTFLLYKLFYQKLTTTL